MGDKRIVFYVDDSLHREIKSTAAREGMSMKETLTIAFNDFIDKMNDRHAAEESADAGVLPLAIKDPAKFEAALNYLREFGAIEDEPSEKSKA